MGKIIFRVVHLLFLLTGVVLVTSITDGRVRQSQVLEHSHDVYETGDITFLVDGNYVKDEPVFETTITQNDRSFNVYMYDVVYSITVDETTTFNDGLQLIVEQTDGEELPYSTSVVFAGPNDYELTIAGMKYYDLPLYITYDQDNAKLRISREELGDHQITSITISDSTETYLTLDVDIDASDLTAKDEIEAYLDQHEVLNIDDIDGISTITFLEINTIPAITRNLAIYIVIATIVSAVIIFYQKRHLGWGKVNPRLKKDLERLKMKEQLEPPKENI